MERRETVRLISSVGSGLPCVEYKKNSSRPFELSRFTLEKRAKRFLKLCCPKGQYKGTNFY